MVRRIIVAGALTLLCASGVRAQAAPDPALVRRTVATFADAWNRHDMDALGRLFAPDADFVNVAAAWWKGRTTIVRNHAFAHGTISRSDTAGLGSPARVYGIFQHSTMTFTAIAVRFARPDLAVAHVSWRLTGDTRTPAPRTGLLTFVLVPVDGQWQIEAAQNTEIHRTVR